MDSKPTEKAIFVNNQDPADLVTGDVSLTLFITNACNERCEHCFYWEELNTGRADELSVGEITRLVDSIGNRLSRVSLTGGEPFVRKDIQDIAKELINRKHLTTINIVTNGILQKRVIELVEYILSNDETKTRLLINVSLDGLQEKHDSIRRVPGSFKKAVATIRSLKDISRLHAQMEVSVVSTISKENFDQLVVLNDFVEKDLHVYHRINLIRSAKTGVFGVDRGLVEESFSPEWVKPFSELELTKDQTSYVVKYFNEKTNWREYHKLILAYSQRIVEKKKKMFTCNAPYTGLIVYPNGEFSFCEYIKPLGNLRDYGFSFDNYWHAKESDERRKALIDCMCNHPCSLGLNIADNPVLKQLLPEPQIVTAA